LKNKNRRASFTLFLIAPPVAFPKSCGIARNARNGTPEAERPECPELPERPESPERREQGHATVDG